MNWKAMARAIEDAVQHLGEELPKGHGRAGHARADALEHHADVHDGIVHDLTSRAHDLSTPSGPPVSHSSRQGNYPSTPHEPKGVETATRSTKIPPISRQQQDGHIPGTPQQINRAKAGKRTSLWGQDEDADALTTKAWVEGKTQIDKDGNPIDHVKWWDAGRPVGTGAFGEPQTVVRVSRGKNGIHGSPYDRRTYDDL